MPEYIYLLQEREFIRTNENIYKVGKTKQINNKHFYQYSKGSIVLYQIICNNCHNMEIEIIRLFKEKFILRNEFGNKYFEGDAHVLFQQMYDKLHFLNL